MKKKYKIRVPVILGPTSVGKTDISLRLASDLGFEILSCDSRQIYRYMDIGTAKSSLSVRKRIQHWMIDIIDPSCLYSAYQFSQNALKIIKLAAKRSRKILICGGAGLYFKSLSEGLWPRVSSDIAFRKRYTEKALKEGRDSLLNELKKVDPETAAQLHPNNLPRIIRALQVYYETGCPLSVHRKSSRHSKDIEFLVFILSLPRPLLYSRINERVDTMVDIGLWNEFCLLRKKGYKKSDPGMQCVGYHELFEVEDGLINFSDAVEKIKKNTRNYAKRQITWFTHKTKGVDIDLMENDAYSVVKRKIMDYLDF